MNKKINNIISYIILIVSLLSSFYIVNKSPDIHNGFNIIWILPLLYGLFYFFLNTRYAIFDYIGIFILNVILFFRYVILPFYSSSSNLFFHSRATITNNIINKTAILLMIYEMICIFIFLHFFIRNLNNEKMKNKIINNKNISFDRKPLKESFYIYYLALFIGMLSFIIFPSVRDRANFFIINDIGNTNLNTISALGHIIAINLFKIIFLIVVSNQLYNMKFGLRPNKFLVYLVLILCISFVASTNRTTILIQAIACLAILKYINLLNKNTLIVSGVISILLVFSLTTYRSLETGDVSTIATIYAGNDVEEATINNLQSYFGGHHLIALAIKDSDKFTGSIEIFFNEILSSINFVRQIYPLSKSSSTVLFNENFGFFDQNSMILPIIGQGYFYLGFVGAPLFSICLCFLIFFIEKKIIITNHIGKKFALYILVSWLALFPLQNLNIISASIFNIFLPFYIIIILNIKSQKLNKI